MQLKLGVVPFEKGIGNSKVKFRKKKQLQDYYQKNDDA